MLPHFFDNVADTNGRVARNGSIDAQSDRPKISAAVAQLLFVGSPIERTSEGSLFELPFREKKFFVVTAPQAAST
jgi:hypothetical protein